MSIDSFRAKLEVVLVEARKTYPNVPRERMIDVLSRALADALKDQKATGKTDMEVALEINKRLKESFGG